MDATAGIAIGSRRRLGRVKHIETVFLLVQAIFFFSKHVDDANCVTGLGLRFQSGESKLTLKA